MFGDRYYIPHGARERYLRRSGICNRWDEPRPVPEWDEPRPNAEDAAAIDELLQRILVARITKVLTD